MTIIDRLASSLNRRDEAPNTELARQIAAAGDKKAIAELIRHLADNNKNIRHDCIKTLYEIGAIRPSLLSGNTGDFIRLLDSNDNRMQWGAMAALLTVTAENPGPVFSALPKLAATAEKGSVITRDNYVGILIQLCGVKSLSEDAFALLNEQLATCPPNQLPMYAENALPVLLETQRQQFISTLGSRLNDLEKESKRKRLEKVLKKAVGK
ncbi:hypothetical protein [Niabella beijingensis]|uniref:hypothetical protein n=1 Tax=Niabella beijingensis TaxID=2872700 RepID=UPI001CBB63AA|nr:hypothetical protein [Niabella beijingensis]MBZ4187501.1 hypothetical protein [Niabella beijingensis]